MQCAGGNRTQVTPCYGLMVRKVTLTLVVLSAGCAGQQAVGDPGVSLDEVTMPKAPPVERDPETTAAVDATEQLRPDFEQCLTGTQESTLLMLHYEVSAEGSVHGMTIEQTPEEQPAALLCFAEVMARAEFPAFGRPVRATVPFEFHPDLLQPVAEPG